jgi:hypothetical protein
MQGVTIFLNIIYHCEIRDENPTHAHNQLFNKSMTR